MRRPKAPALPLCVYPGGPIRYGHQPFPHSAQILGSGRQQELIVRPAEAAQSELVQLDDALEVSEQRLDLLALPARLFIGGSGGDVLSLGGSKGLSETNHGTQSISFARSWLGVPALLCKK